ncbi:MAG TPA: hypothetical protein VKB66_08500, partial [Candidatus Acidoferrum sp.]|nr:hypothetical protein [Candidatus Acidoferrum sp.]
MMNDYSQAWSLYRKLRNQAMIATLGFLPGLVFVRVLPGIVPDQRIAEYAWGVVALMWIVAALVTG